MKNKRLVRAIVAAALTLGVFGAGGVALTHHEAQPEAGAVSNYVGTLLKGIRW